MTLNSARIGSDNGSGETIFEETKHIVMHKVSHPEILYFGTPVVLISTCNEDNTFNLAPISSIFWLGWRCVIGIAAASHTTKNLRRTGECVLNLPSVNEVAAVNKLARLTGSNPVPDGKMRKGYRYEKDKFGISGLTPVSSETVLAPRTLECPVNMEATVQAIHGIGDADNKVRGGIVTVELVVQRVHLHEAIVMDGQKNKVDPNKWRPLIMSFQQFYGLGEQVHESTLSLIDETQYHSHDMDKAKSLGSKVPVNKSILTPN